LTDWAERKKRSNLPRSSHRTIGHRVGGEVIPFFFAVNGTEGKGGRPQESEKEGSEQRKTLEGSAWRRFE